MRKRISAVCFATALMMVIGGSNAFAQPSSKVSFKGNGISAVDLEARTASSEGWKNVWTSPIIVKTPSDKDLVMSFSAECGLVTNTKVMSRNLAKAVANADAMIEVRVLVDGEPVQVGPDYLYNDSVEGYEYSTTMERDGYSVIYARRAQSLIAEFGGSFATCDQTDTDGDGIGDADGAYIITPDCVEQETLQLVLSTMNANSFDFVAPDLAPIEHEIMVQARLTYDTDTSAAIEDSPTAEAAATAFLGYTSFTMDTVRMVKDAEPIELQ